MCLHLSVITTGKRHKVIVGTPFGKPGNPKGLTRVWKHDPDYKIAYVTLVSSQSDYSINMIIIPQADGETFKFPTTIYGNLREETIKKYY